MLFNYNDLVGEVPAMSQLNAFNSFWSGVYRQTWNGLHTNVGAVYNNYSKFEAERYTFQANASFDLFPGGSDKGRHNIQFGILYEQRVSRDYGVAPFGLWTIARQSANNHIIGDTDRQYCGVGPNRNIISKHYLAPQ